MDNKLIKLYQLFSHKISQQLVSVYPSNSSSTDAV